jgi:pSer/pThr/pTyr-binding forkhead associated (FHA) protein
MAKLIIYEDFEDKETVFEDFELTMQRILIGSGPDNQLVLEAPEVEPIHASLELRDRHWILQDLGGPGGTLVNGVMIEGPLHLHHGDLVELGSIKITFQDVEAAPESASLDATVRSPKTDAPISGRIWFATIAGGTIAVIFIILFLLIVADYLGVLKIADLFPLWPR